MYRKVYIMHIHMYMYMYIGGGSPGQVLEPGRRQQRVHRGLRVANSTKSNNNNNNINDKQKKKKSIKITNNKK